MIKGIMFDKDDTLLRLDRFWYEPCKRTVEYMLSLCLTSPLSENERADKICLLMTSCGFTPDGSIIQGKPMQSGTNEDVIDACICQLCKMKIQPCAGLFDLGMAKFHENIYKYGKAEAYCNLSELFGRLKDRGIAIGVATSDEYKVTLYCLKLLGVDGLVDCIISADRVAHPKPAPDTALEFCRITGLSQDEILMVGDSENDVIFAKNCGILSARFLPRSNTSITTEADFVIRDLFEVAGIVDTIG